MPRLHVVLVTIAGAFLISGLLTVTAPVAWAATTTLYVSTTGSNTTNCTSSATACKTIQDAIAEAEGSGLSGSPVTIDVAAGTYDESDTTFADDTAEASSNAGYGGGLYVATENSATLTNDTLSGNDGTVPLSSIDVGGGLYNNGTAVLTSDTLSDDSGDGGIVNNGNTTGATVTLSRSLLAGGDWCNVAVIDGSFNVENDDTCGLGYTDVTDSATIGTMSLAANGSSGPETEVITSSSSAFGEVPLRFCATTIDERGQPDLA